MEVEEKNELERIELESSNVMVGWGLFTRCPALGGDGKDVTLIGWMRLRNHAEVLQKALHGKSDSWICPVVVVNDEVLYDSEGDLETTIPKLRKVAGVPPWLKWHYGPDLVCEL